MNLQEMVTLMQIKGGVKLVQVSFLEDRRGENHPGNSYTYKAAAVHNIQPGDIVAVEARDTYALARVVAIMPTAMMGDLDYGRVRHVIAKIDLAAFFAVKAAEAKVREDMAMAEIDERLRSVAHMRLTTPPAMLGISAPTETPHDPETGEVAE